MRSVQEQRASDLVPAVNLAGNACFVEEQKEERQPIEPPLTSALDDLMADMPGFLRKPLPQHLRLECIVKRNRSWLNYIFPVYTLTTTMGTLLLAAKKMPKNKTSTYHISMSEGHYAPEDLAFLAKVRSNFLGSRYGVYKNDKKAILSKEVIAVVLYVRNILRKARKPSVRNRSRSCFPAHSQISKAFGELNNKRPLWVGDERMSGSQSSMEGYRGRVQIPSVKNFQIVNPRLPEEVLLQAGKTGKNEFILDFQYPFSPVQAFALALTSYDFKLT